MESRKVRRIVGIVLIAAAVIWYFSLVFTNPDMTVLRLIIEYRVQYVVILCIGIGGLLLSEWGFWRPRENPFADKIVELDKTNNESE